MNGYLIFAPDISDTLRSQLLKSTELFCCMCGIRAGQFDSATGLRALLHIANCEITPEDRAHINVSCSICVDGRKELPETKARAETILAQLRIAGTEEQRAVYEWLNQKFKQ